MNAIRKMNGLLDRKSIEIAWMKILAVKKYFALAGYFDVSVNRGKTILLPMGQFSLTHQF
jgi:hypothetical protein